MADDRAERCLPSFGAPRLGAAGRLRRHTAAALHGGGTCSRADADLAGAAPASGDPSSAAHASPSLPPRSSIVSREAGSRLTPANFATLVFFYSCLLCTFTTLRTGTEA